MKVSAILPAFNEAKRINNVLQVVVQVPSVEEIIVIDDGSTDGTLAAITPHHKIKTISLPQNVGKTWAVVAGVKQAKNEHLLLLDADLCGLAVEHIENLIESFQAKTKMAILDYGSQEYVLRHVIKSFPALSGVRLLTKEKFLQVPFHKTDRFELENRINRFFIKNNWQIKIVPGPTVYTPHKFVKYGIIRGTWLGFWALKEIFFSNGYFGALPTYWEWRSLAKLSTKA